MKNIRKIGIAGAGTMGYSMAQIFGAYGYEVTLWNHREEKLAQARELMPAEIAEKICFTTDMGALAGQDLIVENLAENVEIKKGFYTALQAIIDDSCIIATNTSGLSINLLGSFVKDASRFLGMHWFNPPHLIPLIEIIRCDATSDEAAQAIYDLSLAIDKKPAIVKRDVPGFAANRLQFALVREALSMVKDGVIAPEDVDSVLKYGLGFRWACLGPLETMDFGGLDIFYHIAEYLMKDLNDSHEVPELLAAAFERGDLGVKTEKGFYDYSNGVAAAKRAERDEKLQKLYDALYR